MNADTVPATVKNPNNPKVTCKHCCGSGKVPLTPELQEVYTVLRRLGQSTTLKMAEVLRWTGHVTAMNNRLDDLAKLGLVVKEWPRHGKSAIYKPA